MSLVPEGMSENRFQELCGRMVGIEIRACVTRIVEFCLHQAEEDEGNTENPFSYDDIPYWPDPVGEDWTIAQCAEALQDYGFIWSDVMSDIGAADWTEVGNDEVLTYPDPEELDDDWQADLQEYLRESVDFDPREIFEWWIVSGWLAGRLQERGEIILNDGNSVYWGRQCTGQAIKMDGVIREICAEARYGFGN